MDFQSAAVGLCCLLLRQIKRQNAVFIGCADVVGIDSIQREGAAVGTIGTFTAQVVSAIVLLFVVRMTLGIDGQAVTVNINVNVFLPEARQIGGENQLVAGIFNIGTERSESIRRKQAAQA